MTNDTRPTPTVIDPEAALVEPKLSSEAQADIIEARSPEGRPADPTLRGKGMLAWLMLVVGIIAVAAAIVGATLGLAAAVAVFVVGLGLGIVVNTEAWAAVLRAKERRQADRETAIDASPRTR